MRAPKPAGPNGQPAEQTQSHRRKRRRDRDLAARAEKRREGEQRDPAGELEHGGELARIGLQIFLRHPQQDREGDKPEQDRHRYLICASSLRAPSLRCAVSALTPPAA